MRILHMDVGREMRGGQRQALLLMRGLQEAGHSCRLLARPGSPLSERARALGLPVHPADLRQLWSDSPAADLVHVHDARSHTLAAIASRTPFVVSRRVAFPLRRGPLTRWKYRRALHYLAVSRFVAEELGRAGIPADKIDIVYDAVEIVPLAAGVSGHFGQTGGPELPAVALDSADPQKGRALAEQAAAIAGVPIVFSNDLVRDLRKASMFLYITHSEGLGSAALLAMSLQVPVIASRVGGLPELVAHEQSGLLVDNNAEAIAQAMRRLIGDPALAAELGRHGRLKAERHFTPRQMIDKTLAVYRRALGDAP